MDIPKQGLSMGWHRAVGGMETPPRADQGLSEGSIFSVPFPAVPVPPAGSSDHTDHGWHSTATPGAASSQALQQLRPEHPARWLHFNDTDCHCRVNKEHGEIFYSYSIECLLLIFE